MTNEANRLKEEGNQCFREKRYHKAIELYTQSLQLFVSPTVLGNRAQCYINLERWSEALMDCNRALELDPNFEKALYRRAFALQSVGLKTSAIKDLDRCLTLSSNAAAQTLKEKLLNESEPEVIKVDCVEKGDEIRSDSEFFEIVIDIPRNVCQEFKETVSLNDSINPVDNLNRQFVVPTTHRKFLKDYHELERLPPENFAKYFLEIPTSRFTSLFGELLELEMIGLLLRGFVCLFKVDECSASQVYHSLISLADVPRFKLLVMFFGENEKRGKGEQLYHVFSDLRLLCEYLPHSYRVDLEERFLVEESIEE